MSKILKLICILFDPTVLLLRMYSKEGTKNINVHKYFSVKMLTMALVKTAKKKKKNQKEKHRSIG